MTEDNWIQTQVVRKNFNLKTVIDEKFLKAFQGEFDDASVKILRVDVALMDKDESIIDIISLMHKNPSFENRNMTLISSNKEPYFISKIKKVIDYFQNNI